LSLFDFDALNVLLSEQRHYFRLKHLSLKTIPLFRLLILVNTPTSACSNIVARAINIEPYFAFSFFSQSQSYFRLRIFKEQGYYSHCLFNGEPKNKQR